MTGPRAVLRKLISGTLSPTAMVLFVAVSSEGGNRVMTSSDGITWTARSAAGNNDFWYSVTYGNGLFVAVGFRP